jgi:hypothetical protein
VSRVLSPTGKRAEQFPVLLDIQLNDHAYGGVHAAKSELADSGTFLAWISGAT